MKKYECQASCCGLPCTIEIDGSTFPPKKKCVMNSDRAAEWREIKPESAGIPAKAVATPEWIKSEDEGFPLTTQKEGRAMLLKGYGNAIVPGVAAAFVMTFEEAMI